MSRAFRLGVFIVGTLAMLATGVFLIGDKEFLFSSTYQIKTTFKNVAGLVNGAEVRVGGIHEGTVKRVELPGQPDGLMTVVMKMHRSTHKVIRADSVASIQTEGLLGSKYVEISFGSGRSPQVEDGGSVASEPPLDFADVLKKADDILDTTKQTMGNVQETADHVKHISAKIDQGQGTLGALVNDKHIYAQLNDVTTQAKLGAAAFQENMQALKHNWFLRGFFNSRGYNDSTQLTQHAVADLPKGPYLKIFRYDGGKIFEDVDTAKIDRAKTLNDAGRFLEDHAFGMAVVVVYGGMKGDAEEVRTLTQARAMVVRDYLVKNFRLNDARVRTMGSGKDVSTADTGAVAIVISPVGSDVRPATLSGAH